ncbi:aspartate aminotransferase [Desulfuribacillus stibiiarsenatis]|uniref:Aminotransferase n=1 Tax=Desulfuribacillus stibiiarsenatis TaxID=1390249 RepID=A0A1E5L401_9FIRM|nr:pyridoxal phosphate-dependent aminotransferase [Desulfuribacillus stibiiarsenatis]OEH84814.1 aspartate aminotransferase [Desulfuribacillus stibiiarsenatis]
MKLSKRVETLTPSTTLAITAKAKELKQQGINVISFGAGEPDYNTPEHIIEVAYQSMKDGQTKYTPAAGLPELRKAICAKLKADNNLQYEVANVCVCSGAKHALYNIFQVICNPGDEVIIPIPFWVSYPEQVKLASAVPVYVEGIESNLFKITAEQLGASITDKTKALILNSPSNPSGTVYSKEELEAIAAVCVEKDILVISDEIYEKLVYDGTEHVSIASLNDEIFKRTLVVNGVSKPYSMTGWRIGYVAGDKEIINAIIDLSSHSTSNPTTMAQWATLEAITGTQEPLNEMVLEFDKRRKAMVDLLNQIDGISCAMPTGAFYAYANVQELLTDDVKTADAWAAKLLEEANVAVIPGSAFGSDIHIRLSYATSMKNIEAGIQRIKEYVEASNK